MGGGRAAWAGGCRPPWAAAGTPPPPPAAAPAQSPSSTWPQSAVGRHRYKMWALHSLVQLTSARGTPRSSPWAAPWSSLSPGRGTSSPPAPRGTQTRGGYRTGAAHGDTCLGAGAGARGSLCIPAVPRVR